MKLHTVRVPHHKNTKDCKPVVMPARSDVTLPMSMHIGAPARPIVKAGDRVYIGTPVGEPSGAVSAYVHSSVSGIVKSVSPLRMPNGAFSESVVITPDGSDEYDPSLAPREVIGFESFIEAVRASGAVGLGGAGFPTMLKLSPKDREKLDTVIINGAECEPYITSDTRTMIDRASDIVAGISYLRRYLGVPRVIIGLEDNKPECADALRPLLTDGTEIRMLPSLYPQGGEKVLIYNLLHRVVPEGQLPMDVGVIVINCTTLAFVGAFLRTGKPLTHKCVTVDGDAVKEPKNVWVPIGTPIGDVFEFAGGFRKTPVKILMGGPMMGIPVADLSQPVQKSTNALLAFSEEKILPAPSPCIRCGRCVAHCPMNLCPPEIAAAYENSDMERLAAAHPNLCMECGACAYVCPAHRPLVENHKLAKRALADYLKKKKEATR